MFIVYLLSKWLLQIEVTTVVIDASSKEWTSVKWMGGMPFSMGYSDHRAYDAKQPKRGSWRCLGYIENAADDSIEQTAENGDA